MRQRRTEADTQASQTGDRDPAGSAPGGLIAPSIADIEALAATARASLPAAIRGHLESLVIRVADFAPEEALAALGMDDPFTLTGLYEGTALPHKSVEEIAPMPDTVWLFRRAILDEWADRGDVALGDLVAHILVHEIAHHFGWSDAEIAAIDPWWT
ncbi:MAG: metallopeptidase family protein [Pseudomonadota bacterium]